MSAFALLDLLLLRLSFFLCLCVFQCMHVIQKRILSHTVLLASVVLRLHCSPAVWEELKCVCVCGGTTDHIEERLFINNWLFNSNTDVWTL